ncbi:DUF4241 domain-containing protein [Actinacidiphila yeochonensis]|uniref:DUF4241 domain-containing protein n=1 Tax=Actinacidiphila yeochonensis TaxID=89050 RepID=UPI000A7FC3B8|nr:DUF4241 domain-containing protein [Actinacidiphila yeochonensis]
MNRLFSAGSSYQNADGDRMTVVSLPEAELTLPTGQVAACDPDTALGEEIEAFTDQVSPGAYRVVLSVVEVVPARHSDVLSHAVAAAWLQTADVPTARWSVALLPEQSHEDLSDTEFYGYGVDGGTGCFVDASAAESLGSLVDGFNSPIVEARFAEGAENLPINVTDPDSGLGVVAFSSGFGDGHYPTWVGHAEDGTVTGFVTEFFVVPQPGRDSDD